ncbi:MAG: IclR family transcriptional regulator [Pseudomonadota bacterium]|jgi:DNA-binding IclR family transcriptional regulator
MPAIAASGRNGADTGTIARAVAVLAAVSESPSGVRIHQLAAALALPASTVHRLLERLIREGMVERDTEAPVYRAGREFLRIAARVVNTHPVQSIAGPFLDEAVRSANETAYLCLYLPAEHRLTFAAHRESTHPLGYRVRSNEPQSLLEGASGRSILAWLDEAARAASLAREATLRSLPARRALLQDLAAIRERGYALSRGQRIPGAVGLFAPVFGADGQVVGSLGYTVPEQRFRGSSEPALARRVRDLAARLSTALGARTCAMPTARASRTSRTAIR